MGRLLSHWSVLLASLPVGAAGPRSLRAQAPIYRNLVMEGSGIRGIAYGGKPEKRGVLVNLVRVGGTSAGAIQAALLAVGYPPDSIVTIPNTTPVQRRNDGRASL